MLADRINKIAISATGEVNNLVSQLKSQGENIYSFNVGEPDFDMPDKVKEAAIKAIEEGKNKYTAIAGLLELRQAICRKLQRDNSLTYNVENICVSCGVKQSLHEVIFALCDEKDQVIIPTPCWVTYTEIVKMAGAEPIFVKTREDYSLDTQAIEKAVNEKTKAIIINSPNNPTGAVYCKEDLQKLAQICLKHKIYIISDEVYEKILFDGNRHISIASLDPRLIDLTITLNGFSKAYSMTGCRLGYAAGPKEVIDAVIKLQSHNTSNAPSAFQWAAITALEECDSDVEKMRKIFEARRDLVNIKLKELENIKFTEAKGAFYVMLDVKQALEKYKIKNSVQFCKWALEKAKVALVPGEAFGAEGCVRLSFARDEQTIIKGIEALKDIMI